MARERSFQFPTATGTVAVSEDGVEIRSTPGHLLAGQRRRWRHGDGWDRAGMVVETAGIALSVAGVATSAVAVASGTAAAWSSTTWYLVIGLVFAARIGRRHVGETRIPMSAVDAVTLDRDAGTLTIEHDAAGRLRSAFGRSPVETTLSLPSADAVREAESVLRARGIDFDVAEDRDVETTYRATIREGAWFCERCGSQVSPADAACPACGYAIRVESVAGDRGADAAPRERDGRVEPATAPSAGGRDGT